MKWMMYYGLKVIYWPVLFVLSLLHFPRFSGRENLPEGAAMLCANHSGLADPIWVVLAMHAKKMPYSMAKKEVMQTPVIGGFLRWFGAFPVDREGVDVGAIKKSLSVLKAGDKLLIFPEGTRVKKGMHVEPKPGALMIAHHAGVPVVPIYITHHRKPFQPIRVNIGKPFQPVYEGRKPTSEELERETKRMMRTIYAMGEPS